MLQPPEDPLSHYAKQAFRLICLGTYTYRSVLPRRSRASALLAIFACLATLVSSDECVIVGVIGAEFFLWCLDVPGVPESWQAVCVVLSILYSGLQCPRGVDYAPAAMACGAMLSLLRRFLVYCGVVNEPDKQKKDD